MTDFDTRDNRYQFAMPVRWSETQSILFDKVNVEKLVEFGPSPTLLNMAKKTLGQFNLESDAVNGIKRSLLSTSSNYDDLRYDIPPPLEPERVEKPISQSNPESTPGAKIPTPEAPPASTSIPTKADSPIPDVPITGLRRWLDRKCLAHST